MQQSDRLSISRSAAVPATADLIRLDTGSALRRVKSPPVNIPISLPLLPRWDELAAWVRQIDRSRVYTNRGPLCSELERRLESHFLGRQTQATSVCLTASGTSGLIASLLALDLEPGSLCVLPSWTSVATASAVVAAGLIPYLIDVDVDSWALDPARVDAELGQMPSRPCAVIPVSPFGAPVDVTVWREFSRNSGIAVVIDAAAGFDSVTPSDIPVVVSLYATEPLGVGEGGFVICTDPGFIERIREVTNFGFTSTRIVHHMGLNAKLSEYHAAIGLAQLQKWRDTRRTWLRVASTYRAAFAEYPDIQCLPGYGKSWTSSTAVFRFIDRSASEVAAKLDRYKVESRRWWQRGVNYHPAFADAACGDLTNTNRLADETLALPCYLTLRDTAIKSVVKAVTSVMASE